MACGGFSLSRAAVSVLMTATAFQRMQGRQHGLRAARAPLEVGCPNVVEFVADVPKPGEARRLWDAIGRGCQRVAPGQLACLVSPPPLLSECCGRARSTIHREQYANTSIVSSAAFGRSTCRQPLRRTGLAPHPSPVRRFDHVGGWGRRQPNRHCPRHRHRPLDLGRPGEAVGQRQVMSDARRSKTDARAYVVRLTDTGRKVLDASRGAATLTDERLFAPVAASHRARFLEELTQVAKGTARSED